ncbi:RhoGAP domain-containing protein [Xylariales sp. AK1849]|nr:RhoGAP domain-containing protein [Xylariales sp. AK1849]
MSQLALQRRSESPSDSQHHRSSVSPTQDSPTIGRALINFPFIDAPSSSGDNIVTTFLSPPPPPLSISTSGSKSQRKPAPSPLHTNTAVSPPSSASPNRVTFPSPIHASFPIASVAGTLKDPPRQSPTTVENPRHPFASERRCQEEDPSPPATPISPLTKAPGSQLVPTPPNDTSSVSDQIVTSKPIVGSVVTNLPAMAGGSSSARVDPTKGAPRTSSLDSVVSNVSSKSPQDALAGTTDVANLIKAAGSPEAVIQYLLKEKQSQSQQNAQLWRLVDKQRAMILGLNKDLERALKDKEKYRKKMKEVMSAHEGPTRLDSLQSRTASIPRVDVNGPKEQAAEIPESPSNVDSDSIKHSPMDMAMAPYPITPPADQMSNGLPSAVGDLLDPSHLMPKPSEHALDSFDHEEEDRAVEETKKAAEATQDLPFSVGLPPSRSLPSEPPRMPPPKPPVSSKESTPMLDQTISQFPPPSAPPPRKPPPAPLQLRKELKAVSTVAPEDENESDSDYDSLLEVDELPLPEKRGRRRTREEDDEEREIIALQEAERRSLSKKSKKGSQKGTPKEPDFEAPQAPVPVSPRMTVNQPLLMRENIPASLAGVLSGNEQQTTLAAPLMSPGLPSSPRPIGMQPFNSPPLSPRMMGMPAGPLSPRAPRQPIPLPPNTPLSSSSGGEPLILTSPKPLNIMKRGSEPTQSSPPGSRGSQSDRQRVYKGLITEEFPELLLPPNALPSIEVRVASSRMKPSRASLISLTQLEEDPVFTLAIFYRSGGGELWRVEKDTASLVKLDQKLKMCAAFTAKTPDRSLFSGHAPAKLDARRIALNQYLDELLNSPLDTQTALELCKYLSTNTLPPNSDDTGSMVERGSEDSSQKTGPGGRPLKSGYLTKRGKNFGGWKARFFVLDGPLLKYFETPGGAHLGTIKLLNAQIGKQQSQSNNDGSPAGGSNNDELDNQYRHAFLVLEPKKKDSSSHVKHVLCAESDKERDQWVETLLRWIDYRDSEDDESHANAVHDRQASGGSAHVNGMNAKKKMYGQAAKAPTARSGSQDGLIGISYEGTKQGDIPDGAPSRRRNMGTPEPQPERPTPPSYSISAPRDPQVISDSSSWGGKVSLAPPGPSLEEKKQRKRSFFGFGPKTRSSSDDQDPLFGSSGPTGPQSSEYRGPTRQVFGAPLAEAVRYNGPVDVNVPLPAVVFRCIQYLDAKNAILEEGIFRLSGSNVIIKQLRERFNVESDVNLLTDETYYDIHAVASLLKLYLRELPTTILTRDLHLQFLAVTEMSAQREKIAALSELVQHLPQANGTLLRYLIAFLIKIINNADMNKMTVRNVGIVFSPTLNIPAPVFALLLQNYEGVFNITPEEYELPSPVSEADSRPPPESQPRRPSTGTGAAASPHRQRLIEQLQQQRSTPTPPPALMSSGYRVTPTPSAGAPPGRQMGYEPQYLAQQQGNAQASLRPAYEGAFMAPTNYDSNMQARNQQPTYDRPHLQSSYEQNYGDAGYDQPFATKAKRRESSMFMGNVNGLNHQGSKNRLYEDNRM